MKILSGHYWNKGSTPGQNQDSLVLQQYLSKAGTIFLAVVCDGIGGLAEGENASGYVTEKLVEWLHYEYCRNFGNRRHICKAKLKRSIFRHFYQMNVELNQYAERRGIMLGTTVTMFLLQENQYVIAHSGDSRLYSVRNNKSKQLTKDHCEQESVLQNCVGAGVNLRPDVQFGRLRKGQGFLLCTDGFYHFIKEKELATIFVSNDITEEEQIIRRLRELGDRAIRKGERDNLSAIYVLVK